MENVLGTNIRRYRLARGLTQRELADPLDVQPNTVSDWERGRSEPNAVQIPRIAALLGVSVGDLFSDPQEPSVPPTPDRLEDAIQSGDWRQIALALAEAQREHGLAARIRAEADRLAQENIRLALERGREDAGARVPGHSEAATIDAGD